MQPKDFSKVILRTKLFRQVKLFEIILKKSIGLKTYNESTQLF